ncbi:MAG: FGGY family carbohydrate kinase [Anaerolineales bacterium]
MSKKKYSLGIDIGTSGAKAGIFDEEGELISIAQEEYHFQRPRPGWSEIDPEEVWRKVCFVIRQCVKESSLDVDKIVGVGLSVLGETFLFADEGGNPIHPAIESMDGRDHAYQKYILWLKENLGAEDIFRRTSYPISSLPPAPKILWFQEHKPEIIQRTSKIVTFQDFAIWRLTGTPAIDYSMASRTMLFDANEKAWIEEYLQQMGLSSERFSAPLESSQVVGQLSMDVANELGLTPGIPVVPGAHDQSCAALGVGIVREGIASDGTGSVEAIATVTKTPISTPDMMLRGHGSQCHVRKDLYLALGFHLSAGSLVRWYRDCLGQWERELAAKEGKDPYDLLTEVAERSPPGAKGLLVFPHWSGAGTGRKPALSPNSRGAIFGLTLAHEKSDISRAIFEGITFEARYIIESLESCGIPITDLVVTGGGAKSAFWLQLKADITGKRIVVPEVTEASLLGAALLAGAGAGLYSSLEEAVTRACRTVTTYEPQQETVAIYNKLFPIYRDLYDATIDISGRLTTFAAY